MALIVEDGTNVANAESFATVAFADAYHLAMGNTTWAGATLAKEQALRRATAVLDGYSWAGFRTHGRLQALSWPRSGVVDVEGLGVGTAEIPSGLQKATVELALRELVTPGSLTPDFVAGASVKREKVDVLEVEYANPATSVSDVRPVVTVVAAMVAPYLSSGGGSAIVGTSYRA